MKITSKGQVTIPREIRRELGLLPHTEVVFEVDEEGVRLRRAEHGRRSRGERIVAAMRGQATVAMSTDEILSLTRDEP